MASKPLMSPTHTAPLLGHKFPALSRARVERDDVLLGPRPSLLHLRRRLLFFVRQVHRYYGAVRPLGGMPVRSTASPFRTGLGSRVEPRSFRGLPVLVDVISQRARVLRLRRADLPLANNATSRVAFPHAEAVGVPDPILFRSSIARPTDAPVYASTKTSRLQSQDSGSRWSSLSPFL